jgi:hypothetical protein
MAGQFAASKDRAFITSLKFQAGESPVIKVPQDAQHHQVAISPIGGAAAGTATVTVLPVGMTGEIPLYEADGATPVVLNMADPGDARSEIIGSLQNFVFTTAGFDGASYKLSVTSYF